MNFTLFIFAEFEFQNMNSKFHAGSFETGTNQELRVLGTGTAKKGTINWRQGLGPHPPPSWRY